MRHLRVVGLLALLVSCSGNPPGNTGEDSGTPQQQVLDPAQCTISVAPATVIADGAAFARATITLRDTAGSPIANLFVGLSVSGTGNTLPSTASTDAQGKVVLGFTSTVAELKTVKAVLDPLGTPQTLPPEAQVTFIPGPPSQRTTLEWLTATAPADGSTPARARLTLRDANDNLISGAAVTFSTSVSEAVAAPASGSTDAQGQLETQVTSTRSGAVTLTATVGSFSKAASFTFAAGAPHSGNTTLTVAPTFTVADGVSSLSIVTAVKDLGGTPVPNVPVSVSVTGTGNGLTNGTGNTASNGEHAAALTSTVAESKTITVSVANGAFSLNRTVSFQPGGASVVRSTLTASPATIPIFGTSVLTLTTKDSQGNIVGGVTVGFSSTRDGGFVPDAGTTDGGGLLLTTYTALQDGIVTLRATGASGFQVSTQITVDGTCLDGQQNGQETDVDCGGAVCGKCNDGDSCQQRTDCVSDVCTGNICRVPTCVDTRKNGIETDVDCGGDGGCSRCGDLLGCDFDSDCTSGRCLNSQCQVPACPDGRRNGIETDVDCGGDGGCARCNDTLRCANDSDCVNVHCVSGFCAAPTCSDVRKNGQETGVDCGGPTTCNRCGDGLGCFLGTDCTSEVCDAGSCQAPTCVDTRKNGIETDVDCGGDGGCNRCADTRSCANDTDCTSTVCTLGTCRAPLCTDLHKNGFETDVDCGGDAGSCPRCNDFLRCANDSDCTSSRCVSGFCAEPTCTDARRNGAETDVDCGGSSGCPRCGDTKLCLGATDCVSKVCSGTCQAPTCIDGVLNGIETDLDCGGDGGCPRCANTRNCANDTDCQSLLCTTGTCRPPSCPDGRKNGFETDLDCGGDGGSVHDGGAPTDGGCPRCLVLQGCNLDSDCVATPFPLCIGGRCREMKFDAGFYGPTAGFALGVCAVDRTGDNRPEVFYSNYSTGGVTQMDNDGTGALTGGTTYPSPFGPNAIASADFNLDGRVDLIVAGQLFSQLGLLLGLEDGGFGAPQIFGQSGGEVQVGDFNKDGKPDVVSAYPSNYTTYYYQGDGDGGFAGGATGTCVNPMKVAIADVDGDGNLDYGAACNNAGLAGGGYALVVRGQGNGSFFPQAIYSVGESPYAIAFGDLNGDARPELLAVNYTFGTLSILMNNGDGTFGANTEISVGWRPEGVVAVDFNGDGFVDVGVSNNDSTGTIFLGRGNGTLSPPLTVPMGSGISYLVAKDMNGDGKPDLVGSSRWDNPVTVLLSQCR